ncbi:MAG: hypothetical protein AAFV19_11210 [Pseudomonadota bacterium]
MTDDEIKRLVDDELARRRIGAAFEEPKSVWRTIFRHPLFLTVFAFFVTTIIGGTYDQILTARAEAKAEADQAVAGLREFSTLVFERQTRGDLLRWAVVRGDAAEAKKRKEAYDAIYVRWNNTLILNLRDLRAYLGRDSQQSIYEVAVERSIVKSFSETDACLTHAYDVARRAGFPHPPPEVPPGADLPCAGEDWRAYLSTRHDQTRQCMITILNNMIPQIRLRVSGAPRLSEEALETARTAIRAQLEGQCPGMAARADD